jgi:hypothetical protein
MIKQALLVIFILLSTTNSAMAYIDPGIGAIFVQGLIGIIAGFSLFFSKVRDTLRRVLGMTKDDSNSAFSPESKEQSEKSSKHKQS